MVVRLPAQRHDVANSQRIIEEQFQGVPTEVKHAMLAGTAAGLYALS